MGTPQHTYSDNNVFDYIKAFGLGILVVGGIFYYIFTSEISLSEYDSISESVKTYNCPEAKNKYDSIMLENGEITTFDFYSIGWSLEKCSKEDFKIKLIEEIKANQS